MVFELYQDHEAEPGVYSMAEVGVASNFAGSDPLLVHLLSAF
jgi:hypothetical protein